MKNRFDLIHRNLQGTWDRHQERRTVRKHHNVFFVIQRALDSCGNTSYIKSTIGRTSKRRRGACIVRLPDQKFVTSIA
jgi:hypothetical protein